MTPSKSLYVNPSTSSNRLPPHHPPSSSHPCLKSPPRGVLVVSAFEDYAYDRGMRVGDRIIEVDGVSVASKSVEEGTFFALDFTREHFSNQPQTSIQPCLPAFNPAASLNTTFLRLMSSFCFTLPHAASFASFRFVHSNSVLTMIFPSSLPDSKVRDMLRGVPDTTVKVTIERDSQVRA